MSQRSGNNGRRQTDNNGSRSVDNGGKMAEADGGDEFARICNIKECRRGICHGGIRAIRGEEAGLGRVIPGMARQVGQIPATAGCPRTKPWW